MAYYGIYTPSNVVDGGDDTGNSNVFTEKIEALKVLKDHKDGRLKVFNNIEDAKNYAQSGYEATQVRFADLRSPAATVEKAAFRAPTKQELVQFRKLIETDNEKELKNKIWDNPRYLLNSGDTPTNLKEAYRYNALHVCAIHNKPRMARLILEIINNPKFVHLLHGKRNDKISQEVSNILLDYYLNMPEKGRNETPLHLATKNGFPDVVEVFTSYAECKMLPNFENQLPKDIICDRADKASPELKAQIGELLKERFYVPVIRSVDNIVPPTIGEPFSPSNIPHLNTDPLSPEVEIQAVAGPMTKEQAQTFRRRWKTPPRSTNSCSSLGNTPFVSPIKFKHNTPIKTLNNNNNSSSTPVYCNKNTLHATRALDLNSGNHSDDATNGNGLQCSPTTINENNNSIENMEFLASPKRTSVPESYEITPLRKNPLKRDLFFTYREHADSPVGCNLNESNLSDSRLFDKNVNSPVPVQNVPNDDNVLLNVMGGLKLASPKVVVPSIQASTPVRKNPFKKDVFSLYRDRIASPLIFDGNVSNVKNGSLILDNTADSPAGLKERHVKLTDTEKGLEMIGRELAKEQKVEWTEFWDFLDSFVDISSDDGLLKLETYFNSRAKAKDVSNPITTTKNKEEALMSTLCCALDKLAFGKENQNNVNGDINNSVESRFLSDGANSKNLNAPQSKTPYLCVEKSLQVFAKRMTKTILNNIESVVSINDTFLSELKRLKSLICSFKGDSRFLNVDFGIVHSRFANLIATYLDSSPDVETDAMLKIKKCFNQIILARSRNDKITTEVIQKKEHLQCVSEFILEHLATINTTERVLPENLKTEQICSQTWKSEVKCDCQWESKLSRQESRKKRFDLNDASRTKPDVTKFEGVETPILSNISIKESWRPQTNDISSEDICNGDDDEEEDVFWSDQGSVSDDDERFYTPPESLIDDNFNFDGYNLYILGSEPTKRDLDVLNAIFHVTIDEEKYPNIHLWRAAVLHHPNEDRDNFPSPSVVVKRRTNSISSDDRQSIAKRLFMTPSRGTPQRPKQFDFLQRKSRGSGGSSPMSCASPGSSSATKNLSFMNVSDMSDC